MAHVLMIGCPAESCLSVNVRVVKGMAEAIIGKGLPLTSGGVTGKVTGWTASLLSHVGTIPPPLWNLILGTGQMIVDQRDSAMTVK